MKQIPGSRHAEPSFVDRLVRRLNSALVWFRFKGESKRKLSPRKRYEAAIDSSTITPEQRRKALENAAADPGIEAVLDAADRAHEQHVKGLESGELHGRAFTPGSSRH